MSGEGGNMDLLFNEYIVPLSKMNVFYRSFV